MGEGTHAFPGYGGARCDGCVGRHLSQGLALVGFARAFPHVRMETDKKLDATANWHIKHLVVIG